MIIAVFIVAGPHSVVLMGGSVLVVFGGAMGIEPAPGLYVTVFQPAKPYSWVSLAPGAPRLH